MSSFRVFACATAGLTTTLSLVLLLAPELIVMLFGMEQAVAASVLGRRASMLFLGYSVMLWSVLDAPHSAARQSILYGIAVFMLGLACTGVFEFLRGAATWPIVLASAAELGGATWALRLHTRFSKDAKTA